MYNNVITSDAYKAPRPTNPHFRFDEFSTRARTNRQNQPRVETFPRTGENVFASGHACITQRDSFRTFKFNKGRGRPTIHASWRATVGGLALTSKGPRQQVNRWTKNESKLGVVGSGCRRGFVFRRKTKQRGETMISNLRRTS